MRFLLGLGVLVFILGGAEGVRAHLIEEVEYQQMKKQATAHKDGPPKTAGPFLKFPESVLVDWDEKYLYVGSDGMPTHPMMVGITAWQQQVPLPQSYYGKNAWSIPLQPVPAAEGMSAKTNFFRGAIAVAANGIPIFNPIKNDGRTDTFLAGELDQYGGHAGRADDYHYHVAPWHLAERLGTSLPLAYALDGYPIYGLNEPDGSQVTGLDSFHGHTDAGGEYHYHASKSYPYINGGFHGQVSVQGGGVDPQPNATPVREATTPLPGAKITGFESSPEQNRYRVEFMQGGKKGSVAYQVFGNRQVQFAFTDPDGTTREQTGVQGRQGKGGGERPPEGPKGNEKGERGPPRENDPNRKPWIENHISEMDSDRNGKLSQEEMMAEVKKVFEGYDGNDDGKITEKEANERGVHSAMAGFIRQHFTEVDADKDGAISLQELKDAAMRMWEKYTEGSSRGSKRPPPPQNQP